jgi:hypothetical protein
LFLPLSVSKYSPLPLPNPPPPPPSPTPPVHVLPLVCKTKFRSHVCMYVMSTFKLRYEHTVCQKSIRSNSIHQYNLDAARPILEIGPSPIYYTAKVDSCSGVKRPECEAISSSRRPYVFMSWCLTL